MRVNGHVLIKHASLFVQPIYIPPTSARTPSLAGTTLVARSTHLRPLPPRHPGSQEHAAINRQSKSTSCCCDIGDAPGSTYVKPSNVLVLPSAFLRSSAVGSASDCRRQSDPGGSV